MKLESTSLDIELQFPAETLHPSIEQMVPDDDGIVVTPSELQALLSSFKTR